MVGSARNPSFLFKDAICNHVPLHPLPNRFLECNMERQASNKTINNDFYEDLEERWYTASDHPIALLRAENAVRVPWIIELIGKRKKVLDVGCGAGILTNALSKAGHEVDGIDLS